MRRVCGKNFFDYLYLLLQFFLVLASGYFVYENFVLDLFAAGYFVFRITILSFGYLVFWYFVANFLSRIFCLWFFICCGKQVVLHDRFSETSDWKMSDVEFTCLLSIFYRYIISIDVSSTCNDHRKISIRIFVCLKLSSVIIIYVSSISPICLRYFFLSITKYNLSRSSITSNAAILGYSSS